MILFEIGHRELQDYFRRHLNNFEIIFRSLLLAAYKTLPVALRTHNHEDHTIFSFRNFSCKFYSNFYSSKVQKVSSISSKLCPRFSEPKFQLPIWRLWKYWWATTNSRRPCIQLWLRIQVCNIYFFDFPALDHSLIVKKVETNSLQFTHLFLSQSQSDGKI